MLAILYNVLQMNKDGMKCLSFFDNGNLRFTCPSDMNSVTLYKNQTGTFKDDNLVIDTEEKKVICGPIYYLTKFTVHPEYKRVLHSHDILTMIGMLNVINSVQP